MKFFKSDKEKAIGRLGHLSRQLPQLRVGQILANALMSNCKPEDLHQKLFYITDEELSQALRDYVKLALGGNHESSTSRQQNSTSKSPRGCASH